MSNEIGRDQETVIEAEGLVKRYGDNTAVDGVGFTIAVGEIFGILGTNGAGKTTLVECLQGLRRPDEGRLHVLGLDPTTDRRQLRMLIGSQLQDAALPDRLRVQEAVGLFDRGAIDSVGNHLETWGLAGSERRAFGDLSGGQRQRLFIALALLNNPRLVFLDELTRGLDPAARRDVWRVVQRVRDEGATVVLVSHFADEVEELCDRVVVMDGGTIIDGGTPRQLTDRHGPPTTISFTPSPGAETSAIDRLPGVAGVERLADGIRIVGTSAMVAPVCAAALDRNGHGPPDLSVQFPSLDDALVNLIGARP